MFRKGVSPRPADRSIITASALTLGRNMSRKGVSPLVAGVFMVVITVAVAIVLLPYMTEYAEETAEQASEASLATTNCMLEHASIDRVNIDTLRNNVRVVVVADGRSDVVIKELLGFNKTGESCSLSTTTLVRLGGVEVIEFNCPVNFDYDCSEFDYVMLTTSCGNTYKYALEPALCIKPEITLSGGATGVDMDLVSETATSYVYNIEVMGAGEGYADITVLARNALTDAVYKNVSGSLVELNSTYSATEPYIVERDGVNSEITLRVYIGDPWFIIAEMQGLQLLSNGRASDVIEFSAAGWNDSLSLNLSNTSSIITAGLDVTGLAREGGVRDDWWNSSWDYRQPINITNNAGSVLEEEYTLSTEFDLNTCVNQGKCLASGNDTRIIWYNTSFGDNVEIDRILEPSSALKFDGTDDYVDFGSSLLSTSDSAQPYSVFAWIKADSITDNTVVGQYDPDDSNRHIFRISNGKLEYWKNSVGAIDSSGSISTGTWYLVGWTRNSIGSVKLYINRTQDGSGTDSYVYASTNTQIGTAGSGYTSDFKGTIDEVVIFNRSLSSTEIADLYNGGIGKPIDSSWFNTTGLVGLWHFDSQGYDNSTTAYDSSGNGNNGTIYGAYHTDGKIIPNAETTNTFRFKTQAEISASSLDTTSYDLYYGNPVAGAAPADGSEVYASYTDWNTGTAEGWTAAVGTPDYSGYYVELDHGEGAEKTQTLNNVMYCADFSVPNGFGGSTDGYEIQFKVNSNNNPTIWIAGSGNLYLRYYDAGWVDIISSTWAVDTAWHGVCARYDYTTGSAELFFDDDSKDTGTGPTGSTSAMMVYSEAGSGYIARWDNVRVRKYISPEPTTSLLSEQNQTFTSYPSNVSLDVDGSGADWTSSYAILNVTEAVTGIGSAVQSFLSACPTPYCLVPLNFSSDTAGKINVSGIDVRYY